MVWGSLSISGWGGNGPGLVHHVWVLVTCSHLSMLCYHGLGVPQHLWLGRQWPRAGPPCMGACYMLSFVHAVLSWSGSPLKVKLSKVPVLSLVSTCLYSRDCTFTPHGPWTLPITRFYSPRLTYTTISGCCILPWYLIHS